VLVACHHQPRCLLLPCILQHLVALLLCACLACNNILRRPCLNASLSLSLLALSRCSPSLAARPLSLLALSRCSPSLAALLSIIFFAAPAWMLHCSPPSLAARPLSLLALSRYSPSLAARPLSLLALARCSPSLPITRFSPSLALICRPGRSFIACLPHSLHI
jgi:hypothetical protein